MVTWGKILTHRYARTGPMGPTPFGVRCYPDQKIRIYSPNQGVNAVSVVLETIKISGSAYRVRIPHDIDERRKAKRQMASLGDCGCKNRVGELQTRPAFAR